MRGAEWQKAAIPNIRRRGRELKAKRARELEEPCRDNDSPDTATPLELEPAQPKRHKVYVNVRQAEQLNRRKRERDDERKATYKKVTLEVAAARSADTL